MKNQKYFLAKMYILIVSLLSLLEIIFRVSVIKNIHIEDILSIFLFVNAYALIIVFFIRLLPRKIAKIVGIAILIAIVSFYTAQDLYYRVLKGFFSFSLIGDAHAGIAFLGRIFKSVSWMHLLYLIPLSIVIWVIKKYRKKVVPKRFLFFQSISDFIISASLTISVFALAVITIPKSSSITIDSPYAYSTYDLYVENPIAYQTINKFGVLTYLQRDIVTTLTHKEDYETMKTSIDDYLDTLVEHEDNAYTGLFEGKNMILIMAESFDTYAIDPILTPNLYQLQQNSWNFTNYYSPLYFRNTADTEFMSQTSLYAHKSVNLTMDTFKENTLPNTFPRLFGEKDYGSYSFHNYTDYFYPRSEFHPTTLGYDEYYDAIALGLLDEDYSPFGTHEWQSDVDLVNGAMDILSEKEEPFFTYMLTVSGHLPYSGRHPIAEKNLEIIEQLMLDNDMEVPYDDFLYYHAANYELDQAIGVLLDRLEEENMLDDTVIMLYGDHYAYGIDQDKIAEYDDTKSLDDSLSFQRVPMMIYTPSIQPMDKDEVFASIDIMPTLANLFNLNLDYDQVFGKDIFGNQDNAVLFSNGSLITNDFKYNLESDEMIVYNDNMTDAEATVVVNEYIYRMKINEWILEIDYFKENDE